MNDEQLQEIADELCNDPEFRNMVAGQVALGYCWSILKVVSTTVLIVVMAWLLLTLGSGLI